MWNSIWNVIVFIWDYAYPIAETSFLIIGALKVISRYTPWKWDDKVLTILEKPALWLTQLLSLWRKAK